MFKLISTLILLWSTPLFALGQTAHRVTGAIAEQYLNNNSRDKIAALIGKDSLAEISTYVDEMRALKSDHFWSKTTFPYHFVTVPDGKTYLEVGAPPQGDAYSALMHYSKLLKNSNTPKTERIIALKFIVHIIGDLHQPLHVGNGLDRGGNDIKVKFIGRNYNLHSIWDTGMIARKNLSYSELSNWLGRKITSEQVKKWSDTNPLVWIKESYDIRQTIYPDNDNLHEEYMHQHLPTIEMRIQQAGVRIAAYLNEIFSSK